MGWEVDGGMTDSKPFIPKLSELTNEQIDLYLKAGLVDLARVDCPEGFEAFYEVIFGERLPAHALEEWIRPLYNARQERKGIVCQAFRGSTKTTTMTSGFTAYRIGLEPHRANLLIQVGDDIAQNNAAAVARIIADNPGWKLIFPNVVPDIEKGWGAAGYEVKRVDIDPGAWSELNAKRKDPTFVGLGYSSRGIIGKHPDGVLIIDDIHDENNTFSERELAKVLQILNGTILKTRVGSTWIIAIGTPWVEGDALDYLEKTGRFVVTKTPVYREIEQSDITFNGTPIKLTWPKVKTLEFIKEDYDLDQSPGKSEFYRMMLLDLSKIQQRVFTWQTYPAKEINAGWPMVIGCDYAGTSDEHKNKVGDNDYFALAYVMKLPMGGAVVYDGIRQRVTQAQAEGHVVSAQSMFKGHYITVVEGDGKGEEFLQVIRRNPGLRLLGLKTGGKGKAKRLERYLQPALASGMVKISDGNTPFLNALRKELADYPNGKHDDTLDAVYWALRGIPDVLVGRSFDEDEVEQQRSKKPNPFSALAHA